MSDLDLTAVTARAEAAATPLPEHARMYGDGYGFYRTGTGAVDAILSAVVVAGHVYPDTANWMDYDDRGYYEFGNQPGLAPAARTALDLIDHTAQAAAERVNAALADIPTLVAEIERLRTEVAETKAQAGEEIAQVIEVHRREKVRVSVGAARQTPWERATSTALAEAQGIARSYAKPPTD